MKLSEKLIELIEQSDFVRVQKSIAKGFIERLEESDFNKKEDINLIEKISNSDKIKDIIISTDEVKIFTVFPRDKNDDWATKYPFRSIYKNKKGDWSRVNTVSPTVDTAFLCYLEYKYLDSNSRFTDFALKMLEIKIEE